MGAHLAGCGGMTYDVGMESVAAASPRHLHVSLCATALAVYGSYSLVRTPVLPLFARSIRLPPELIGLVVAASTITGIFLKLPAGALSDLFGRRRVLILGAAIFALAPFLYLLPHSAASLISLRFVHGAATAVFGPVMAALISDLAPRERRGRWLGTYAAAQSAGNASGQLLGGVLLSLGGFFYPFVSAGVCGALGLLLLPRLPVADHKLFGARMSGRLCDSLRLVLTDRAILLISVATAGQYLANGAFVGFLPLYAQDAAGLAPWQIGILFGVQTGCVLAFRPVLGTLSDHVGRAPVMVGGLLTSAAALLLLPSLRSFAVLLLAAGLYGAAFAATSATSMAWITDQASRSTYGTAQGAYGTIFDVGDAAGPIVAGVLIGALGYGLAFRLLAMPVVVLALFLSLTSWWLRRTRDAVV